jgi:hypothetical protein
MAMSIRSICAVAVLAALGLCGTAQADRRDRGQGHDHRASAATIAARTHFFGYENVDQRSGKVDKDKVILSWFSVTSFAVAARGHVFLLDSYIYRLQDQPGYVPTTVQELVDLEPESIFIGHGHGDHADNAAYIAARTGARIFGAAEHCTAFNGDIARMIAAGTLPAGSNARCTSLTTVGSVPGTEVSTIDAMYPDVCITTFKHLHSGAAPVDPNFPVNLINPVRDPRAPTGPVVPPPTLNTRTVAGAGGAVSMLYQFTVGKFSFLWHNTAGPIKAFQPHLVPMLAALPKVDVEIGSVVSLGETTNGVYDIGVYIQQIKPKLFYANHTDNFNIGASAYYQRALLKQFEIFGIPESEQPEIPGLHDPYDYLRPGLATFDWKSDRWDAIPDGKRASRCPTSFH